MGKRVKIKLRMTRRYLFCSILFFQLLWNSCSRNIGYQGDWIVIEARYGEISVLENIAFRNMRINLNEEGGSTPVVHYLNFEDKDIAYDVEFNHYKNNGSDYLDIKGSKFFTDTFEVRCLTDLCCRIALENNEKYVELIFNGELSTFQERRNCPNVLEILEK